MKILYCKNIWWPFGSHLMHVMTRKIYCDMNDYKLLYTKNNHPAYSMYSGEIERYFPHLSDVVDEKVKHYIDTNFQEAGHNQPYVLEFSENNNFIKSDLLDYTKDIASVDWDLYFPSNFSSIEEYRSTIMKKIANPSDEIKNYINNLSFVKEVNELNGKYIGVHIRWTDKVHGWSTETEFYDVDVYFNHAIKLREQFDINTIVLNCDNTEALSKFLNYNIDNKLNFNILYDKEEQLPENKWYECIFQKWASGQNLESIQYVNDLLNGFKIYKVLFDSNCIIGNYASNMCAVPAIARNCEKDINITNKTPYSLLSRKRWKECFTNEVIQQRIAGREERKSVFK